MPFFMLSGFVFPIANMPTVVQWLTYLNPLQYFLVIVRGIFLNAAGALVWAVTVASGGYLFGHALEVFIGKFKSVEIYIMGSVAIVGLLVWVFHFYRRRRRRAGFIAKS